MTTKVEGCMELPGPPKRMAQYPKVESIGSIGSIMLDNLEVQVGLRNPVWYGVLGPNSTMAP